ncbi:hypothetical protein U8527_10235 [Kordia algicida OT-1]|uniref:DUF3108 domain-containing protein n=1 Tax=Kordia algicida OT-1 TaxID=391587 RepID=A9DVY3_9FLAO|nr:hypothetical protein [Kordia algicida]EDP96483.1 hypothetical protein KAOT1_03702 [Kordia algicida OT-1]
MKYILIVIFGTLFTSDESAKSYYFPLENLKESKIYVYSAKENPLDTEYWKLTYNVQDSTLVTEAFHSNFEKYEYFREKITDKGTQLEKFISFVAKNRRGKSAKYNRKPIKKDVYLWSTKKPYTYSAYFMDEDYGKIILIKTREFIKEETLTINTKTHNVLKFKETYTYKIASTSEKYTHDQITYYAKGIGLVRMEKNILIKKM